jgi:signal transduction histidine kinase
MIKERLKATPAKFRQSRRTVTQPATWSRRVVLTVIAAVAVLVLDAITPLGLAVWLLQVVLVWVATLWANRRQIIAVATVCATFIVLAFVLSPKTGPMTWVDQSNLLLSLGTVWALTHSCLRRIATDDARRKAARELGQMFRVLSGLLPMCAWCKKIRNDAGTWEPLEIYLRNHSRAEITHGMCQECASRFNP